MSGAGSSQKRKADAPAKTQTKLGRFMSGGSAAGNIRAERRDEPPSSAIPETAPHYKNEFYRRRLPLTPFVPESAFPSRPGHAVRPALPATPFPVTQL